MQMMTIGRMASALATSSLSLAACSAQATLVEPDALYYRHGVWLDEPEGVVASPDTPTMLRALWLAIRIPMLGITETRAVLEHVTSNDPAERDGALEWELGPEAGTEAKTLRIVPASSAPLLPTSCWAERAPALPTDHAAFQTSLRERVSIQTYSELSIRDESLWIGAAEFDLDARRFTSPSATAKGVLRLCYAVDPASLLLEMTLFASRAELDAGGQPSMGFYRWSGATETASVRIAGLLRDVRGDMDQVVTTVTSTIDVAWNHSGGVSIERGRETQGGQWIEVEECWNSSLTVIYRDVRPSEVAARGWFGPPVGDRADCAVMPQGG